jgi:hypothetical protein
LRLNLAEFKNIDFDRWILRPESRTNAEIIIFDPELTSLYLRNFPMEQSSNLVFISYSELSKESY